MSEASRTRPPVIRADLFGGRGEVRVSDLLGDASAPPFSAVLRCELAGGGSVGAHRQQRDPEIVVGLGGVGRAFVDDVAHALAEGDVVFVPHGRLLRIENLAETPLRYLIIKATTGTGGPE